MINQDFEAFLLSSLIIVFFLFLYVLLCSTCLYFFLRFLALLVEPLQEICYDLPRPAPV